MRKKGFNCKRRGHTRGTGDKERLGESLTIVRTHTHKSGAHGDVLRVNHFLLPTGELYGSTSLNERIGSNEDIGRGWHM